MRLNLFILSAILALCGCVHTREYPESWSPISENNGFLRENLPGIYLCNGETNYQSEREVNAELTFVINLDKETKCETFEVVYDDELVVHFYKSNNLTSSKTFSRDKDFLLNGAKLSLSRESVKEFNLLGGGVNFIDRTIMLTEEHDLVVQIKGSVVGGLTFIPIPQYHYYSIYELYRKESNNER